MQSSKKILKKILEVREKGCHIRIVGSLPDPENCEERLKGNKVTILKAHELTVKIHPIHNEARVYWVTVGGLFRNKVSAFTAAIKHLHLYQKYPSPYSVGEQEKTTCIL